MVVHIVCGLRYIGLQIGHKGGGGHIEYVGGEELGRQDLRDAFWNGCELLYQIPCSRGHVRHGLVSDSVVGAFVGDLDSQGLQADSLGLCQPRLEL